MAQSTDKNLANQSGANFRSELNTILSAITSNNSGSTEPSGTKVPFEPFVDTSTTPATYKIRNAANDGFITIGGIDQPGVGCPVWCDVYG